MFVSLTAVSVANSIILSSDPSIGIFGGRSWSSELELEAGVRGQESGVSTQGLGVRSQGSGVRSQESVRRSQGLGVRSWRSELELESGGLEILGTGPTIANKIKGLTGSVPNLRVSRNSANRGRGLLQNGDRTNTKSLLPTSPLPRSKCHWSESSFPAFAMH